MPRSPENPEPPGSPPGARAARATPRIACTRASRRRMTCAGAAIPADVDRAGRDLRAGALDQQTGGHGLRVHALLGRQSLLEAPRRLAAQTQAPRGAVDVRAVPRRHLQQYARRVRPHLRAGAALHARRSTSARPRPRSRPSRSRACASRRRACPPARLRARGAPSGAAPATWSRSNACSGWPVSSIA